MWIKHKHGDVFGGSSHCSTFPPSHRRNSTMSTKDLPQRELHREITTQHLEYTTPLSNTITSTREGRHKAKAKKKCLQLGDPIITNSLGDLKGSQIFLTKQRS